MTAAAPPRVLAIVLNWRSADETLRCVAALARSTHPCRVLVVDNGSGDGSVERLRSGCPAVEVLALPTNTGYAGGNNRGIRHALGDADYVWLLNPDTIVAADCLAALLAVGEREPRCGVLGPLLLVRETPARVLSAGGMIVNGWLRHRGRDADAGQFTAVAEVDYVMGCAVLVRRPVIERVGLLDERYFLYGEEVDWCRRARRAGFASVVVPAARAWHPDPASRDDDAPDVTYYMARNQLLYAREHGLGRAVLLRQLLRHLRTLLSWTLRPRWRHRRAHRTALVQALRDAAHGRWGARG